MFDLRRPSPENAPMSQASEPSDASSPPAIRYGPRRWWQISLRTLLLVIAAIAVAAFAASWYEAPYRRQREAIRAIERAGGTYQAVPAGPAWLRRLFGEDAFRNVKLVNVADCDDPEAYLDHVAALPALETLVVGGLAFTDDHLRRLQSVATLTGLVLDCTEVSDEGLAALREALPQVEVYRSQRRAIETARQLGAEAAGRAPLQVQKDAAHPRLLQLVGAAWFEEATGGIGFLGDRHRVTDAELPLLARLVGVRNLRIDGEQIGDQGITQLAALKRLGQLTLNSSRISDAGFAALDGLNLHTLALENARVGDASITRLANMKRLYRLDLSGTRVSDAGMAHLKDLTNLRNVCLNRTRIGDAGMAHLGALPELWLVQLSDTQVTDEGMKHCRNWPKLQILWLKNTEVGDDGLAPLEDLMLRDVRLGKRVTDAGLRHLEHRTSLRILDLSDTQVTDKGLEYLKGLRRLYLTELMLPARASPAVVQELRRTFPKCNIRQ